MKQDFLRRLLAPLQARLGAMLVRGVVQMAKTSGKLQTLQLTALEGETLDGVEHFQPYGLNASPLEGAEAVLLCLGGHRDHAIAAVVTDRRHRTKNLPAGEVMLETDEGDAVHLKRGNRIEVRTDGELLGLTDETELRADSELKLVCGSSSITMTPSSITISSPSIDLDT